MIYILISLRQIRDHFATNFAPNLFYHNRFAIWYGNPCHSASLRAVSCLLTWYFVYTLRYQKSQKKHRPRCSQSSKTVLSVRLQGLEPWTPWLRDAQEGQTAPKIFRYLKAPDLQFQRKSTEAVRDQIRAQYIQGNIANKLNFCKKRFYIHNENFLPEIPLKFDTYKYCIC